MPILLLLILQLWTAPLLAAKFPSKVLYKDTIIRKTPNPTAKPLGVLPRGTVAIVSDRREGDFILVQVKLEEGKVTGWIPEANLRRQTWQAPVEQDEKDAAEAEAKKKELEERRANQIPLDEGVLLRREPTFLYGFSLLPHYGALIPDLGSSNYSGIGFGVAGNFGWFIDKKFSAEGELSYHYVGGQGDTVDNLTVGYLGVGGNLRFLATPTIELMGGLYYFLGVAATSVPTTLTNLETSSDLSTLAASIGAGYRWKVHEVGVVVTRFRYFITFSQSPVWLHLFALQVALEFNG